MEERPFHPLDYLSVLRRRKWWLITPVVLAVIVGALLATFLPRVYYTEAEIGIAAPTLSPELLRGVQSLNREELLRDGALPLRHARPRGIDDRACSRGVPGVRSAP